MNVQILLKRLAKLGRVVRSPRQLQALFGHRVLAGTEHRQVLARGLKTVVDIGANRGQFALAARDLLPNARIISFEPLSGPATVYRAVFAGDARVQLHEAAIGPDVKRVQMHVSARDDSSSILPISNVQTSQFPGTEAIGRTEVLVSPLSAFVAAETIVSPALLKLDVQGFEYEALLGCESLLSRFDLIYCECSFVEFYQGQKMAADVIAWLSTKSFDLTGLHNVDYDDAGKALQADFLFRARKLLP